MSIRRVTHQGSPIPSQTTWYLILPWILDTQQSVLLVTRQFKAKRDNSRKNENPLFQICMSFFQLLKLPTSIVFNYGHHESHLHSLLLSMSRSCFTWCHLVKKRLAEKHLALTPHYFIYFLPVLGIFSIIKTHFLNTKQGPVVPASECDTGLKKIYNGKKLDDQQEKKYWFSYEFGLLLMIVSCPFINYGTIWKCSPNFMTQYCSFFSAAFVFIIAGLGSQFG